ncbi:hypothetical protein CLAFUR4_07570 [Fulvia fulva]|nr:hypothetical protein CLAFUR4_07570 [Fulvia fulva]
MPPYESPGILNNFTPNGLAQPQQGSFDSFECTQCHFASLVREDTEKHVWSANEPSPRLVICPACTVFTTCLLVDLIEIGGHLYQCIEAHKIVWLFAQRQYQNVGTLQHLEHAMREALFRAEDYTGQALIFNARTRIAEVVTEQPEGYGHANASYESAAALPEGLPAQSWDAVVGDFNDYFGYGPSDEQLAINPFDNQGFGGTDGQLTQHAQVSQDWNHQGNASLPPGETYYADDTNNRYNGRYDQLGTIDKGSAQQGAFNDEPQNYYAPATFGQLPGPPTPLATTQQGVYQDFVNPYVGANASSTIDEFIRARGGSMDAGSRDQTTDDSDQAPQEATFANKSAWQSRFPEIYAEEPTADEQQQALGLVASSDFQSTAVASTLHVINQTRQTADSVVQPSGSKKKPVARRPKHKAPSFLEAMKANFAAKKSQEASQKVSQETSQEAL